jgi:putative SOS response-associated peptidase YedK
MCGRYTLTKEARKLQELYGIIDGFDRQPFQPRYNIAPTQEAAVILFDDNKPALKFLRWGLIPGWANDEKIGYKLINARCETVSEKPSFRSAFKHRRCLVLADGFYEWKRAGTAKQPYWIYLKDHQPFTVAGLWESWHEPDGSELQSFSIITTGPNELMQPIHDRMPVILPLETGKKWLDSKTSSAQLNELLKPHDADAMSCHPVSPLVNSPKNERPDCVQPLEYIPVKKVANSANNQQQQLL